MKFLSLLFFILFFSTTVIAGDIKWEGNYRFEALKVYNPGLADSGTNKAYILHHLTLRPQFNAYDGLTIHSRFDLLNNSRFPHDQMGQVFGAGLNSNPTGGAASSATSNTAGDQQPSDPIRVNELYANWVQEFGVFTVGRAPMHFGLGMQFNGGFGLFDHWLENRDLIAYKIVMGNFSIMPVLAKSYEGDLDQEDDVNDYILQLNYENPETELEVGFIYQARRSTSDTNSNDTPTIPLGSGVIVQDNYEVDSYNVFVSQWVDQVKVAFEVGFMSGNTGVFANGAEVKQDAFGAAVEVDWQPEGSNWGLEVDLGYASGDDPSTPNSFEGYIFDQNYDVAFLLFNHPMGAADFFRTAYLRNTSTAALTLNSAGNSLDTEAISNTVYVSAGLHYKWAQNKYDLETRLTFAQLDKDPLQTGVDSNAGFELDLGLKYEPFKGFQWINRAGFFSPGAAFTGGTSSFSNSTAFGFETKAAISF